MKPSQTSSLPAAAPFWMSIILPVLVMFAALLGDWWWLLVPAYAWYLTTGLDLMLGPDLGNPDPDSPAEHLFWHRLITLIWFPLQFATIFGMIYYVGVSSHLSGFEVTGLGFAVGVVSGSVGMVYAHELVHQKSTAERVLGDALLASVLYSHFRSEHLQVHHAWVATPRDAVSARYNEDFYRYFLRVLTDCPRSAWRAEQHRLRRAGRSVWHRSNPFWRYGLLQLAMLLLALMLGGVSGLMLFIFQAFIAVWQLELTNYVEHYGLSRRHLGDGKYEHIKPRHSWNAAHAASNWLLINLQRHSDHHYKPERRFPLLQTYTEDEAPQLPFGYPAMTFMAMVPPWWRRRMNPRVRAWRKRFYPDIEDWTPYNRGELPLPRNAV